MKILICCMVVLIAAAIVWSKHNKDNTPANILTQHDYQTLTAAGDKPKMIEIGSTTCVPCQMMEEVLHTLRSEYSQQLAVFFVDVEKDSQTPSDFKIKIIPTQIFIAPDGKEFFRHEGYFPLNEIIAMLRNNGYTLEISDKSNATGSINGVFQTLSSYMESGWGLPLLASFIWGILSVLLSPCHLASIPLIVGFIDEQGTITTRRAAYIATLFSCGILLTIAIIGVITALAGAQLGELGSWSGYLVAGVFILIGLYLFDLFKNPFNGPGQIKMQKRGAWAAFILGLVFGLALGPCTFAYMAPVLAVAFKSGGADLTLGILLLVIYGIGHCSVIILAGTFTEAVQHYLNWNERSKGTVIIKKICGLLVICGGYYLLYKA